MTTFFDPVAFDVSISEALNTWKVERLATVARFQARHGTRAPSWDERTARSYAAQSVAAATTLALALAVLLEAAPAEVPPIDEQDGA